MALKPWYKVVTPREDLREGKPLDASEFAVHLDHVRDGRAPTDYQNPERFFERTYLTKNLIGFGAEVIRRLSGEKTETSAVFNMSTQFGGGKTHALTLLYHLAKHGPDTHAWTGVNRLLDKAGVAAVPRAATAVFVGTEFDSITGRGGDDGTPLRHTPWAEIAFQLGGAEAFAVVAEHEKQGQAPSGEVIRKFLPKNKPCLILMDELMNYVSRSRKSGLATQLYNFLHNLSEESRGQDHIVLAVSIPASQMTEMTAEDQADFQRFEKLLDRLGKPVVMSAEAETSEIIRRRLFEWGGIPEDGKKTIAEYADWIIEHRQQVPTWFPIDNAREALAATYPFHPSVISVFERKWQALPRFQRTRDVLRLLALWVSRAYVEGFKGAHRDPLIGLGTAPLDDSLFRSALFEQLGETRVEAAITTDICGRKDSHSVRLDNEAVDAIKKSRLHRKVATTIFFESNGGQTKAEATIPEIRLAVAEPELDIGNVETVTETLSATCYYLSVDRNRYRFGLSPNLNKLLADRRANIQPADINKRVTQEVQDIFKSGSGVERIYFPTKSGQVPDRACLTLVVMSPDQPLDDPATLKAIDTMTKNNGTSSRTFKSALIWCVADASAALADEARKTLAWEDIEDDDTSRLDDGQKSQLKENLKKSHRDLKEAVWRTYKNVVLLGKDNQLRTVDLGLVHSSAADNMITLIVNRLRQDGDIEAGISPTFLVRNWPPAFKEWNTKSVRDAFFASPQFPRLLNADTVKDTIARGVCSGVLAYVGKSSSGAYDPFTFGRTLTAADVEIAEDVFIITKDLAEAYEKSKQPSAPQQQSPTTTSIPAAPSPLQAGTSTATMSSAGTAIGAEPSVVTSATSPEVTKLSWTGEVPAQKWMNFYTKILAKFASRKGLNLSVTVEVAPDGGLSAQSIEETKVSLRELGLTDNIKTN